MEYEYRVVGINLESTPATASDPAKASSQLNVLANLSRRNLLSITKAISKTIRLSRFKIY